MLFFNLKYSFVNLLHKIILNFFHDFYFADGTPLSQTTGPEQFKSFKHLLGLGSTKYDLSLTVTIATVITILHFLQTLRLYLRPS